MFHGPSLTPGEGRQRAELKNHKACAREEGPHAKITTVCRLEMLGTFLQGLFGGMFKAEAVVRVRYDLVAVGPI